MTGYQHCIDTVRREAPSLTEEQAQDLLEEVSDIAEAKRVDGRVADLDSALRDAVAQRADDEVRAALNEKRQAAMRYRTRLTHQGRIDRLVEAGEPDRIMDYLESIALPKMGDSRFKKSIEASAIAIEGRAQAIFLESVRSKNIDDREAIKFLRTNEAGRLLVQEADKPGSSGNPLAKAVAEAIEESNDYLRLEANRYGADIGKIEGYLLRQSHDSDAMVRAGKGAWIDFIKPLLDWDRTFGAGADDARADAFLSAAYDSIVFGRAPDIAGDLSAPPGMRGPANMGKGLSHRRVLHFERDGEAAWTYMREFGPGHPGNAFTYALDGMARSVAAMQHLGPNPEYMMGEMVDYALSKMHGVDAKLHQDIQSHRGRIMSMYEEAVGTGGRLPSAMDWRGKMARASNWIRNVTGSALLGGTTLASIGDLGTASTRLKSIGIPFLEAHRSVVAGIANGRRDGRQREIAQSLGVGMDGLMSGVGSRWTTEAGEQGQGAFLVSTVMRVTGMDWLNDTMKTSVGLALSNHLAVMAGKTLDALPDDLKREMAAYGIEAKHWDQIRKATDSIDEKPYIDPRRIEDEESRRLLVEFAGGFTNSAILTPGGRTRMLSRANSERGTFLGEASMLFMHLKSFSVSYFMEHLSRFYRHGHGVNFGYAAHLTLSAVVYGYIASTLKDLAAGREPRPLDGEHWQATLVDSWFTGGGGGYYGDLLAALLTEKRIPGQGVLESAAGPGLGLVFDAAGVVQEAIEGDATGAAVDANRMVKTVLPGANIWYARWVLDYFIFWPMAEYVSPGFAKRVEERAREERGHEYLAGPMAAAQ